MAEAQSSNVNVPHEISNAAHIFHSTSNATVEMIVVDYYDITT